MSGRSAVTENLLPTSPAPIEDVPTPTWAAVLTVLDHERFCRWPDHQRCCETTVEDCTCNVADNVAAMRSLGWLTMTDD
jgi:hypothetical protein